MQPRLILFDCDGTLVDTADTIVAAFRAGFDAAGIAPPQRTHILSIVGMSLDRAVPALCQGLDCDPAVVTAHYRRAYQEIAQSHTDPLFPGTLDALDAIDGPTTLMGVVTGKSRRGLNRIMTQHGFGHRFVTTQTADDAASKPAPDMVLQALREAGAEPERTVVIGDTTFDVDMARAAGVTAIGVSWGNHTASALVDAGADAMAHTMGELPPLIDQLVPQ